MQKLTSNEQLVTVTDNNNQTGECTIKQNKFSLKINVLAFLDEIGKHFDFHHTM